MNDRLDETTALLERVQRNLKRYRASVLKAAVEGRLVPTEAELARAEKRDYEPASVVSADDPAAADLAQALHVLNGMFEATGGVVSAKKLNEELGVIACKRGRGGGGGSWATMPVQWPRRCDPDDLEQRLFIERFQAQLEDAGVVESE